jgi:CubicO group peptidase (beta-lactamase class C family)
MSWRLAITMVLITACTVVQDPDQDPVPEHGDRIGRSDAALGAALEDGKPGCSGAVGVEGEVVWTGARGVADLGTGANLSEDTVFDIGKVSHQFTATAVLLLADEGMLRLEDPVSRYLGGLPPWADEVTLDNLIHHTSGLPDVVDLLLAAGARPEDVVTQADALQAIARSDELRFDPGSLFRHSSSDYVLLAEIVGAVTGSTLPNVLSERVFEPLDLAMTMDRSPAVPHKARSYRRVPGTYEEVDWAWEHVGDGGIQTTPSELVRWADNYRTGRLGGSTLRYAQLAGAAPTSEGFFEQNEAELYGAGFFVGLDGGLFDRSEWEGFATALEITPDRRVAAAVACNSDWLVPSATATILTLIWS